METINFIAENATQGCFLLAQGSLWKPDENDASKETAEATDMLANRTVEHSFWLERNEILHPTCGNWFDARVFHMCFVWFSV